MQRTTIYVSFLIAFVFYSALIYTRGTPERSAENFHTSSAIEGKKIWQKYNCTACHQLYGLGGYMGPELTNVISQKGAAYAKVFIENGSVSMPNFHLSELEVDQLIAYLTKVDASGTSPDTKFSTTWYGTVNFKDD